MSKSSWTAVRDLPPLRASGGVEIALRVVRSRRGLGLELTHGDGESIVINGDRLDQAIVALDNALTCLRDLDCGHAASGGAP